MNFQEKDFEADTTALLNRFGKDLVLFIYLEKMHRERNKPTKNQQAMEMRINLPEFSLFFLQSTSGWRTWHRFQRLVTVLKLMSYEGASLVLLAVY